MREIYSSSEAQAFWLLPAGIQTAGNEVDRTFHQDTSLVNRNWYSKEYPLPNKPPRYSRPLVPEEPALFSLFIKAVELLCSQNSAQAGLHQRLVMEKAQ